MTHSKLPIIDQLHNADTDRQRADVLLRCPDAILLKYSEVFERAARDFPDGLAFVQFRVAAMMAVRSEVGGLPGTLALELEELRQALVFFASAPPPARAEPLDI